MRRNIVLHAILFALGAATALGLLYVPGSGGKDRAWILWEHSKYFGGSTYTSEEWTMVLAGVNKRECEKRLAKLADNVKEAEKAADKTEEHELRGFTFDGSILVKTSVTIIEGKLVTGNMSKSSCFPETVNPRSTAMNERNSHSSASNAPQH